MCDGKNVKRKDQKTNNEPIALTFQYICYIRALLLICLCLHFIFTYSWNAACYAMVYFTPASLALGVLQQHLCDEPHALRRIHPGHDRMSLHDAVFAQVDISVDYGVFVDA